MDTVRLGRVLGIGARQAAKTVAAAVDAATSAPPAGSAASAGSSGSPTAKPMPQVIPPAQRGAQAAQQVRQTAEGVRQGSRSFGDSVWRPAKRLSGVLWLEVTGVFFGLFAMVGLVAVWTHRSYLQAGATAVQHRNFAMYCFVALVFTYFTLSSFVRASRRGRRP